MFHITFIAALLLCTSFIHISRIYPKICWKNCAIPPVDPLVLCHPKIFARDLTEESFNHLQIRGIVRGPEKQKRRIVGGTTDSEEWSEVLSIGGMVGRSVKTKLAKTAVLLKDLFIGGIAGGTAKNKWRNR